MNLMVMRSNKVYREILETEWEATSLEVMKEEVSLKEMSEQIKDKMLLMDRVELVKKRDVAGLKNMAKKASKLKYQLKSFGKSKPEDSWHCENCLLTGYDRDIQWKVCILCDKKGHVFCQAFSDSELDLMSSDGFMCRLCMGASELGQIKLRISKEVSRLKIKSVQITAYHSKLKQEQSSLKNKCTNLMGSTKRKLHDILEKKTWC